MKMVHVLRATAGQKKQKQGEINPREQFYEPELKTNKKICDWKAGK